VAPEPHKILQFYISTTSNMISTTIVVEQEELDSNRKVQKPIYSLVKYWATRRPNTST
jgi:hypothetical protein